jgi:hypothetical protein
MRVVLIALMLGSCTVPVVREPAALTIEPTIGIYSKSEIDAINAEAECKRLARNLVQVARCHNRRD